MSGRVSRNVAGDGHQRTHFPGIEAIKRALMTELQRIPGKSFLSCQRRMGKCVKLKGDNFEWKSLVVCI